MRPYRFSILMFSLALTCCSTPKWAMENRYPSEVRSVLKELLPRMETAPDDPALYDADFDPDREYSPQLSDPYWLIPSGDLPGGVDPLRSNNNVSITVFKQQLFLAFRTGPTHFASRKTGIYIISTSDGTEWKKEMELFIGRDVREPFLIPIDGKLGRFGGLNERKKIYCPRK